MENRYGRYITNVERRPELVRPVLLSAFTGWNDAAEASSLALATLNERWGVERFASFDGEEFFDYQSTRPQIVLTDGVTRRVEWPENVLSATPQGRGVLDGRGAVLLQGPEPNFRWRAFADSVVNVARDLNVELVVTVGALLADVPHSRPVSVAANAQDPDLVADLGLSASRYEGPTGITGALHSHCAEAGIPSVSLWASVPHYLPGVPSAPAALAILQTLGNLLGGELDLTNLERTAEEYRQQVSVAVAQDSDLSGYVRMLEERYDAQEGGAERGGGPRTNLPSGDELAQELERFLRDQREE
jgi:proteasome assembly chaperone (PAC2) family protein